MLNRRKALTLGASTLGASLLAGCGESSAPGALKIANASGGLNLTMAALMRQERFLEYMGLEADVLPVADGSKILGGIVSGSLDASFMSGFGQVFPAIAHGGDLRIIGGGILLPSLALFTGNSAVQSLKDLEGRTVGSGSVGALTYQITVALLRKFQVDVAKVKFANIGSSADVFRAVSAGTVDAGLGPASFVDLAADYHVRLIPNGNLSVELAEFTYQAAWTSTRAIAGKRDTLVKALAAYAKLYRFVQTSSSKEAFVRARQSVFPKAPQAEHDAEWTYIQTFKPFATGLVLSPERLAYIQKLNVEFGAQSQVLDAAAVADMSLAQDALKLIGG